MASKSHRHHKSKVKLNDNKSDNDRFDDDDQTKNDDPSTK